MHNVLLITLDDVNAWVTLKSTYGGRIDTPNLDRLAASGVSFTEAQVAVPLCNPSRTAMLSGMSPLQSGVLNNIQDMFSGVTPAQTLPALLGAAGWETVTAGKVFHAITSQAAASIHDQVLSIAHASEALDWSQVVRTTSTIRSGYWTGDPNVLTDAVTVAQTEAFLAGHVPQPGDAGLFLSVGLSNTHAPWVVPKAFFDLYPLDEIVLPANPPGDLDDVPAFGRLFADPLVVEQMVAAGDWQARVQAYLATISYMDSMVGRLLDALDASAIADDTMVVLWSDNGFHQGDKDTLGKNSLWAQSARVPLIIADPAGHRAGEEEARVVSTLDLFPTILDYAGVATPAWADGASLLDLARTGNAAGLPDHAVTLVEGSYSLRSGSWRYTRYEDGGEELYDLATDPHEYVNLAADPGLAAQRLSLAAMLDDWLDQFPLVQNHGAAPMELDGTDGRDILIAGFGADTLAGGQGSDTYLLRDPGQQVAEAPGGGRDVVIIGGAWTDYTMPEQVEALMLGREGAPGVGTAPRRVQGNALANKIIIGEAKALWADGGAGNDTIVGGNRGNTLIGGAGDDILVGSKSRDRLDGGVGNDVLIGITGDDTYVAGSGQDLAGERGSGGFDAVDVTEWGYANTVLRELRDAAGTLFAIRFVHQITGDSLSLSAIAGQNPIEALIDAGAMHLLTAVFFRGTNGVDTVFGSSLSDTLNGASGNDLLEGGAGDDSLSAGAGADTLRGGEGADTLDLGIVRDDLAHGDAGADRVTVTTGRAVIDGGADSDVLRILGDGRALTIAGFERIELDAAAILDARALRDTVIGEVVGLAPGATIALTGIAAVVAIGVTLTGVEVIGDAQGNFVRLGGGTFLARGGDGADQIRSGDGAQTLDGGADADSLYGGAGADMLIGGPGADLLFGEDGNDTLTLDLCTADIALGGAGDDLFVVTGGDATLDGNAGRDTVRGANDLSALTLRDIETIALTGSARLDGTVFRSSGLESVVGVAPGVALTVTGALAFGTVRLFDLTLQGGLGRDVITVGGDRLVVRGGEGDDVLTAQGGAQTLFGGAGRDVLSGGAGDDLLSGAEGAVSDATSDRFLFRAGAGEGRDTIVGFQAVGSGQDRVDILGIGAPGTTTNVTVALAANLLRITDGPDGALLEYRATAMGAYDSSILLPGVSAAQAQSALALFGS